MTDKVGEVIRFSVMVALCLGCGPELEANQESQSVKDSGWLAIDSFEVEATVKGRVNQPKGPSWTGLEFDDTLQLKLVDLQIKFIKAEAESRGWRFNQLADSVEVLSVEEIDGRLSLEYKAVVDMLGRLRGPLPSLDALDSRRFSALVPATPDGFAQSDLTACTQIDDDHFPRPYNFHYYFAPRKSECAIPLNSVDVEVTQVFERPTVYPEYDLLMQPMGDGTVGFSAALVPNRGDSDPASRFANHVTMVERDLGLEGEPSDDESYMRFRWTQGGVTMVIDVYDPTKLAFRSDFDGHFQTALGRYSLVYYNGHSSYGSKHLLDNHQAYTDQYQIIVMHSCQSYAYYTRQVFRAKSTTNDPSGFALADVLATGKSSYPSGSPPTAEVILASLMKGMVAIDENRPNDAPDWESITREITGATWGDILYGMAGVRTNEWQPSPQF